MKPINPNADEDRGLMGVFDMSFTYMVTPSLIRLLYGLHMVVATFVAVGAVVASISFIKEDLVTSILTLALTPLAYIVYLATVRMALELIIVAFNIEKNTRPIRSESKKQDAPKQKAKPVERKTEGREPSSSDGRYEIG